MNRTALVCTSIASFALLGAAALLAAGPLNPPAGPVASTYKTLTEVEPRTAISALNTPGDNDASPSVFQITAPGSYYLTADLVAPAGRIGIEITATTGSVTIDLNGFRIQGPGSGAPAAGIDLGRANNVTILNGSIIAFMGSGINGPNSADVRVDGVRISQSRECGLRLDEGAIVHDCELVSNGLANGANRHGCEVGDSAIISACTFRSNLGDGLNTGQGASVNDCTARSNSRAGLQVGPSSAVRACTALSNLVNGLVVGPFSTVRDCTSYLNTGYGFGGGAYVTFAGCTARDNTGDGIAAGGGCNISTCIVTSNNADGISINGRSTVIGCTVSSNADTGIRGGGTFTDNLVEFNDIDGINAVSTALITNNSCNNNGVGAGVTTGGNIRLTALNSRVENNTCYFADFGIVATSGNCVIVRNTCFSNTTNFSVPVGTSIGTIFVLTGGVDITTSNSFANFEY